MHVTGGQFKGAKVIIPSCAKPTLSKTREAVFNVLFSEIGDFQNKLFLDLYSGSGIMSLEALSRGFKTISLDINFEACKTIKKNLSIAGDDFLVIKTDAEKFIKKTDIMPDVIYIDPPWNNNYADILVLCFKKFKGAVIVVEADIKRAQELDAICTNFLVPLKKKVYGRCLLDFIYP